MSQEGRILEQQNLIGIINEEITIYKAKVEDVPNSTIYGLTKRMEEAENAIRQMESYLTQYYEGA